MKPKTNLKSDSDELKLFVEKKKIQNQALEKIKQQLDKELKQRKK